MLSPLDATMKSTDIHAHIRNSASSFFSSKKKSIILSNEKNGLSNKKENYHKNSKEEGKNKIKMNTKKETETNIVNRIMKDKNVNARNQVRDKMMEGEKNVCSKKREKGINNIYYNINNNSNDVDDPNDKDELPPSVEIHRNNCGVNLTKKRTNLNRIKNSKKQTEQNKEKSFENNKVRINNNSSNAAAATTITSAATATAATTTAAITATSSHYQNRKIGKGKAKMSKSFQELNDRKLTPPCSETQSNSPRIFSKNDDDYDIDVHYDENGMEKEENIKIKKKKILEKYSDLFAECINKIKALVRSSTNENLNVKMNRKSIYNFLKVSYKCSDYNYAIVCAILLLLDRLNNPEEELNEMEKEDLENTLRAYSYHCMISYRQTFKAYHHHSDSNYNNMNRSNNVNGVNNNNNALPKKEASEECIMDPVKKKNICNSIRLKIKNDFLLNCEALINIINLIFSTIDEDKNKFYYIHLNANQYKIISDITETGVKYKYEHLANETYKKAYDIGQIYLQPVDINFLQLASHYINFLYFNLGYEQKALQISIEVFDNSCNLLEHIENTEKAYKCSQILTKIRYNIKLWSKKINKNSILLLTF
ncbi:14-3-3 protein [Plasmodium brasilianum]|uniref:14-3-3 protein, putative n=2 Tax=Plasmodium (Plasmodium) TaxID=418103 RepID=A0A1A8WC48_PLAMA|nr:14-3-3 protein, putative [Plasmodium malariae]KAI4835776.1 14-3-3 protein [Plasmodium brasilianum]SBS89591.1 14-3-3 protein, putative [Plasmodium malariae]SCP02714.1 14-3-3 protein, putative [Plasmodium malariae]